ncbi:glycosyltransferase [Butyrivibrio sp. FCS014]|uniref:glycosyltransferase n=1 Tax=Butyrivibrio sp. FCS014 TaxID=1408304 RepID=UPI000465F9E8|nr:glycosyltransferase [Butyrivibrio sp. FCS014]
MKRIALIPAYMPDDKMIAIVRQLYDAGFEIIIVNDCSSDDCIRVFEEASRYAKVLSHEKNQGKGKALKTGLEFINSIYEAPYTIVTVDADGQQHTDLRDADRHEYTVLCSKDTHRDSSFCVQLSYPAKLYIHERKGS